MKKRLVGMALALTLLLGFSVPARAASFSDVKASLWCAQQIYDMAEAGVINGYGDGTYRPDNPVTCGAALKLVLLAAGYPEQPATGTNTLSGYYDYALKKGFIDEGEITDLKAEASRLLIARLTARALNLPKSNLSSPYADTSDGYAIALYTTGIMQGKDQGGVRVLAATENIKRGEMATVIWRIQNTDWRTISRETSGQIAFQGSWYDIQRELPVGQFTSESFYTESSGYRYYKDGASSMGIDVSSYQGNIDWEAVAASGISFAIIRAGYRGYTNGRIVEDTYFRKNIEGALAAGLDVGVYFFSQAITEAEAVEEADFVLGLTEGYPLQLPVVFDWENVSSSSARTAGLGKAALTACAIAFCQRVESAGYDATVYFNQYLGYVRYDLTQLTDYGWWLADYNATPAFYYGGYDLWQYTSSGTVPGIQGRVDLNVRFD
ncbi:MAG: GH25 family lysozyme [Oscillospiraceae bacterium]